MIFTNKKNPRPLTQLEREEANLNIKFNSYKMSLESLTDLFMKFENFIIMNGHALLTKYSEEYHTNDKSVFILYLTHWIGILGERDNLIWCEEDSLWETGKLTKADWLWWVDCDYCLFEGN